MLKPSWSWCRRLQISAHHRHYPLPQNALATSLLPTKSGSSAPLIAQRACIHTHHQSKEGQEEEEDEEEEDKNASKMNNYFSADFWNVTYTKSPDEVFEWYKSYSEISPLLRKYIPLSSRVLMAGCGNSLLSEDMVKDGYQEIVNFDISPAVISSMQKKYKNVPQLKYMTMNALDLSFFKKHSFQSVIDKGTLDAIMSVAGGPYNVSMMLAEINRILKPGGVYILVTFAGPRIICPLLNTKAFGWDISLYITSECASETPLDSSSNKCLEPVSLDLDGTFVDNFESEDPNRLFIYVCTKRHGDDCRQ